MEYLSKLFKAAEEGRMDDINQLLSDCEDERNLANTLNATPLTAACKAGHIDIVRLLLSNGAEITRQALNVACNRGHTPIAKLLLENGASLKDGPTLLHEVCGKENPDGDLVKLLLKYGVDPNCVYGYGGGWEHGWTEYSENTPILHTSHAGTMQILIDAGADVNATDDRECGYNTPLHYAVRDSRADLARVLLENGADAQALNKRRETPLQYDISTSDPEIISLLLDYDGGRPTCCKKGCGCGLSVALCRYNFCRALNNDNLALPKCDMFGGSYIMIGRDLRHHLAAYEMHFSRMKVAGLTPLEATDGNIMELEYSKACQAELDQMATEVIPGTSVTFKQIWDQCPASLRQVETLPRSDIAKFPIYQTLIHRRYIEGRKTLKEAKDQGIPEPKEALQSVEETESVASKSTKRPNDDQQPNSSKQIKKIKIESGKSTPGRQE